MNATEQLAKIRRMLDPGGKSPKSTEELVLDTLELSGHPFHCRHDWEILTDGVDEPIGLVCPSCGASRRVSAT